MSPPHSLALDRRIARQVKAARAAQLAGDRVTAEAAWRAALAEDGGHPEALYGLGCLHLERGDAAAAIGLLGRALARDRSNAAFHIALGLALLQQGHGEAARAALALATLHAPHDAVAHLVHARVLLEIGRRDDAAAAFDRAAALAPLDATIRIERGAHLMATGRIAAALDDFRAARAARPDDPLALSNLGAALRELGRIDEAAPVLDRAVALDPGRGEALGNRGLNRLALGDVAAALPDLARAAALLPGSIAAARNLASGLYEADRLADAAAILTTLRARAPDDPATLLNLATIALARGDWASGWPGYEARLRLHPPPPLPGIATWAGERLVAGGTLLLEAEQGVGDSLMFLRYVPLAAERAGAPVVLVLPASLHRAARDVAGVAAIVAPDATLPGAIVARVSLGSLPRFFSVGPHVVPPPVKLFHDPGAVPPRGTAALRVGIAWSGNPLYKQDRRRSIPPDLLAPLTAIDEVEFVSLQDGPAALPPGIQPPPHRLRDWADTAALVASVDLVVTVDTAVVHLAGSLGAPTLLLDRMGGDWRWLRGREDTPWYPSVRIIRQAESAWPRVIALVAFEIKKARALPWTRQGTVVPWNPDRLGSLATPES